jgi:hypothetical protein
VSKDEVTTNLTVAIAGPSRSGGVAQLGASWVQGYLCYIVDMTKLKDIEKVVAALAPRELDRFRDWFAAFQAARFDEKIQRDAESDKLDRLAEAAVDDFRKGRAREL